MNFATLPPEITSGRMYEGHGSATMVEAAAAWERLAIRLSTAAADYRAVTCKLAKRSDDPALSAITSYVDWLNTVAAQAEHAAAHAEAAATAYGTARAAMVPPPAIHHNRARHMSLARTNWLGHSGAAIADTEALGRAWLRHRDGSAPEGISLSGLAGVLGQPAEAPHHALGDALTTAQAFIALASKLDTVAPQTVGSLVAVQMKIDGCKEDADALKALRVGRTLAALALVLLAGVVMAHFVRQ